ncbi:hypothetical protein Bra3105_06530 [Brachybacterium halotolerans subsp. kimchii]|uniref:DUF7448 domain-containing protein n=1 Tax=Brachybacterium halotolerans TaxID=2795215 RepID=UPI001E31365F|nr:hypothetical protein [Brachybacterium halotolerans]UEJ83962.1 hypothetical protein Bra3105_06530 [Brachybacterium halotolerans subsp. kimchii]
MLSDDFRPIDGNAQGWHHDRDDDVLVLDEGDQKEISELLIGRKVEKVDDEHIQLDDGTVIKAIGHDGGCACSAGCYDLAVLNGVDNVITNVEYDYRPAGDWDYPARSGHPDDPEDEYDGYYRVFVYADNQQINLMQFNGSDGNGYYGTGFEILVRKEN